MDVIGHEYPGMNLNAELVDSNGEPVCKSCHIRIGDEVYSSIVTALNDMDGTTLRAKTSLSPHIESQPVGDQRHD